MQFKIGFDSMLGYLNCTYNVPKSCSFCCRSYSSCKFLRLDQIGNFLGVPSMNFNDYLFYADLLGIKLSIEWQTECWVWINL